MCFLYKIEGYEGDFPYYVYFADGDESIIEQNKVGEEIRIMPLIDKENYCSKETPDNKNTKPVSPTKEKSLKEIDDQIMTIDDLLNNMDK